VKFPKTKSSLRLLPIPDIALTALKARKVFPSPSIIFWIGKGTYFYPRNVLRQFQIGLKKANLPIIPLHDLRHSCASYHLVMGTSPKRVQSPLDHSSVNVTLNVYSHLLPGVTEEATKNINKIFT
jgi:integrase